MVTVWAHVVYAGIEAFGVWDSLDRAKRRGQAMPRNDQELEDRWEG